MIYLCDNQAIVNQNHKIRKIGKLNSENQPIIFIHLVCCGTMAVFYFYQLVRKNTHQTTQYK